jgi:Dolichyl-phosphate-mannose-protein mannosyltransferase
MNLFTDAASSSNTHISRRWRTVAHVLLGVVVIYVTARSVAGAAAKPFWYDELMTLTVSAQGTWKGIVAVQQRALDSHPPFFYWIESLASKMTRNQEIALRLPSILAFVCTLVCVFLYTRRRFGEMVALLCAVFLLRMDLFHYYAVEARPYSMVVGCFAFALVCYQRVPAKLWTLLFALALALAQSLHYYAIFAMAPFGLAELVYSLRAKKLRWGVWGALAFGALPLVIFWPLLSALKNKYGAHNLLRVWGRVYLFAPQKMYAVILQTDPRGHVGETIAAVIFGVLLVELVRRAKQSGPDREEEEDQGLAQIAILAGFLLLPFLGLAVARATNSGLMPRYFLTTLLGMAAGLAFVFRLMGRKFGLVLAVLVVAFVATAEARFWKTWDANAEEVKSYGATRERLIERKGYKDLSVAVPDGIAIVPLAHYADRSFANRLVFIKQDPQPSDPWFTDNVDTELELYQSYSPLNVSTFDEFASANQSFLFYIENDPTGGWLMRRLIREGWIITPLASEGITRLYLIERRAGLLVE